MSAARVDAIPSENGTRVANPLNQLFSGDKIPKQSHFGPTTFLSAAEIRELSRLDSRRLFATLAFDFAVVVGVCVTSETIGHPLVYMVAVMTIGARLAGIGSVAMHDGADATRS